MSHPYVLGDVAGQRVAFDATLIEAIVAVGPVTRIPRAPRHVAGLCSVRSTVLTVIDVVEAADVSAETSAGTHAAVILHDGHRYALRVGRIDDVEMVEGSVRANDGSIGNGWLAIAPTRIETSQGAALLLDIGALVAGGTSVN